MTPATVFPFFTRRAKVKHSITSQKTQREPPKWAAPIFCLHCPFPHPLRRGRIVSARVQAPSIEPVGDAVPGVPHAGTSDLTKG